MKNIVNLLDAISILKKFLASFLSVVFAHKEIEADKKRTTCKNNAGKMQNTENIAKEREEHKRVEKKQKRQQKEGCTSKNLQKKQGKLTSKSLQSGANTNTRASKEPSCQKEPVTKAHSVCILSADMTESANPS